MPRSGHYGKSCSNCVARKVRCDGRYPCNACIKRECPETCMPKRRKARVSQKDNLSRNERIQTDETILNDESAEDGLSQDLHSTSGLENTARMYPFFFAHSHISKRSLLRDLLPDHADIIKFSQIYQHEINLYHPFIPHIEDLEALVGELLEKSSAVQRKDAMHESAGLSLQKIGVMNALLACGVQLSDLNCEERQSKSRRFAQAAFQCGRLSNFLLEPSLHNIQLMLILCFFLQNDGQADAAWALLGTMGRLAMCAGLDKAAGSSVPERNTSERDGVWSMIIWQDSIMSLCLDRSPLFYRRKKVGRILTFPPFQVHSNDYMSDILNLVHSWLLTPDDLRDSAENLEAFMKRAEALEANANMLEKTSKPSNRRLSIEEFILQLLSNYFMTAVCRSALKLSHETSDPKDWGIISKRAGRSIERTLQAFMGLCKLTLLPFRCWYMVHAALSSAILIEFLDDAYSTSTLQQVQSSFIELLLKQQQDSRLDQTLDSQPWLLPSHAFRLRALQKRIATRTNNNTPLTASKSQVPGYFSDKQHDEGMAPQWPPLNDPLNQIPDASLYNMALWSSFDPSQDFDWSLGFLDNLPETEGAYNGSLYTL